MTTYTSEPEQQFHWMSGIVQSTQVKQCLMMVITSRGSFTYFLYAYED